MIANVVYILVLLTSHIVTTISLYSGRQAADIDDLKRVCCAKRTDFYSSLPEITCQSSVAANSYHFQNNLNMWNEILDESRSVQKFSNASVLVLGNRHTGKRTLIDGLCEVSKTVVSKKSRANHLLRSGGKNKG